MTTLANTGDCLQESKPNQIQQLERSAKSYLDKSKSEATKQAYRSDWTTFADWCDEMDFCALPAESSTICLWITHLADLGRAPSTISRSLTSISQAHKILRHQSPTTSPDVVELYKGIRRDKGVAQARAKPLVLADLKKTISCIRPTFLGIRDRAMLAVGWAGALRRSELVALDFEDIDFRTEGLVLTIRSSKTDQEGEGYQLGIPFSSDESFCPTKTLKHWIDLARIDEGPIFFRIGTPGKKFHAEIEEKRRLSARAVNLILKKRVSQAGFSKKGYSGHSLRAGFVTTASQQETPEYMIQAHTRHRTTKVLRGYMRDGNLFNSNPLSVML